MDLSLGFLFCSIDVYFCLCASTILSWWLWLCNRVWSQAGWFLQFHSSFSRLLWLLEVFCISIQIVKLFNNQNSYTFLDGTWNYGIITDHHFWSHKQPICHQYPWRRKWQPTPVSLPGKSHRQRSLVGYSSWGRRVGHNCSNLACMHAYRYLFIMKCIKNKIDKWIEKQQK